MGSWFSSSKSESKTIDSNGAVNNNIVLQEDQSINIHSIELLILLGILVILRTIEFGYFICRIHQRKLKKKYTSRANLQA